MELVDIPEVAGLQRNDSGELNGVLMADDAAFPVMGQVFAQLPEDRLFGFVRDCGEFAASKGVTTIVGLLGQFVDGDIDVDLVLRRGRRAARQHRGFLSDLGSGKGKSLRSAEDRRLPDPGWRGF